MKKILLLIAAVFLFSAHALSAQGTSVTLQNQEDLWFYFVIDSSELSGLTPSSPLLQSRLTTFFSKETGDFPFTAIKPKSSMTLEGLPSGSHLLVGFFVAEQKSEFPVRVLALTVDTMLAQRLYALYSEPALLQLTRGVGRLARFGTLPTLAEAGKETPAAAPQAVETPAEAPAVQTPPAEKTAAAAPATAPAAAPVQPQSAALPAVPVKIASFAPAFAPISFTTEVSGKFSVGPISESRFWNRDGTRIAEIDAGKSLTDMVVDIVSASGFSKDISYFFYIFPARKEGQDNSYTLELKPVLSGEEGGIAVLWEKGNPIPIPVGKVSVTGERCRLSAGLSDLPASVVKVLGSNPSADVTACFFDAASSTYEEFYYATLSLSEVP